MKSKFSNPPGDTCECIRSEFLIHGLKRSFCSLRTYRSCILLLFAKGAQSRSSNAQKVLSINSLSLGTFVLHLCKMLDKYSSPNATHQTQLAKSISPFTRTIAGFTGDLTKIFETIRVCTSRIAHIGTCRFCFRFWILNSAHRPLCDGKVSKAQRGSIWQAKFRAHEEAAKEARRALKRLDWLNRRQRIQPNLVWAPNGKAKEENQVKNQMEN